MFMTNAAVVGSSRSPSGRASYFWIEGDSAGHVQSLILGAVLFNAAMVLDALGVLGDLLSGQRIMLQRVFERVRRMSWSSAWSRRTTSRAVRPSGSPPRRQAGRHRDDRGREAVRL